MKPVERQRFWSYLSDGVEAHPIVIAAISVWLITAASVFWRNSIIWTLVVATLFGLGCLCLFKAGLRLQAKVIAGMAFAALTSFALQAGVGLMAMNSLGDKAYFSQSRVKLTVLDEPVRINDDLLFHARLYEFGEAPIHCFSALEIPLVGSLECQPRGLFRISVSEAHNESGVQSSISSGQKLSALAFIKPGSGREQFEARLTGLKRLGDNWLGAEVSQLHRSYLQNISGVSSDAKALVVGLAIGDTSALSAALKAAMKTTGLTHLTAVSGANCAIVIGMVWFLLGRTRLDRAGRLAGALAALGAYVLVVGQQPSVLRAAVMLVAVLVAASLGRRVRPTDALGVAIILLLVVDPWLALDYGFLLSVLATLGLVLFSKPIANSISRQKFFGRRIPRPICDALSVVLAAQVLCLPVIIGLGGFVPAYTVAANLLAEPLVAPVTVLGIVAVIASGFLALPTLGPQFGLLALGLTWLASIPAQAIAQIAHTFAGLPGSQLPWPSGLTGIVIALAISISIAGLLLGNRVRRLLISTLVLSLAVGFSFSLSNQVASIGWPAKDWQIADCDVGQGDAFVVRSESKIAVIDTGKTSDLIAGCLSRLRVTQVDLLVLTHFDMDHVGGVSGVLNNHAVGTILETPWPDTRPTADLVRAEVAASKVPVVLAQCGMSGRLGDFVWRILTPSANANEAEDSNDGSIGMLWKSSQINFLTLADLGEKGQMRIVEQDPDLVAETNARPLVLKVAHHGSADFYPELYEALHASVALIGVGKSNSYGHPTQRALHALELAGSHVYRTDIDGDVTVSVAEGGALRVAVRGGG